MADYTVRQLAAAAYAAGFRGPSLATAVAISLAEDSSRTLHATHRNSDGSVDRGPWQINSVHNLPVADSYSLQGAAKQAYVLSNNGRDFTPWVTYKNGAYKLHIRQANAGIFNSPSVQHHAASPVITLPGDNAQAAVGKTLRQLSPLGTIASLFSHLLNPEFWKMVGIGALALVLILIGLSLIVESNKTVRETSIKAGEVAALA